LTWQSALWEVPFDGSAGIISTSLDDLSEREARLLTRGYIESLEGLLSHDVLTPERAGHPEVNAWALAALGRTERDHLAAVTGKPPSPCGVDRERVAGLFLRGLIAAALHEQGKKLEGSQIAIAGFDVESRQLASTLSTFRARVIAVSDRSGALFQSNGLDPHLLCEYFDKEGVVFGYPDAEAISAEELSQLACDVLILTSGHELRLPTKAQIVVEAGGLVNCMLRKETLVLPALLADSGHRLADYLEWRKSACGELSDRELIRGLQPHVRKIWAEVRKYSCHYDITLEQAAMAIAVSRVAQAMRMG
jgi:glutamate dehydrogenase (NAD(P)+)